MQTLQTFSRVVFLKDHPPVMRRVRLTSDGEVSTFLAGSVIGEYTTDGVTSVSLWSSGATTPLGILAEDVTVPATGDAFALIYEHAAVIASRLIWADGVSAADQQTAIAALRTVGVYASED